MACVAEDASYSPLAEALSQRPHIGELTFTSVTAGLRPPRSCYPGRRSWLAVHLAERYGRL